MFTGAFAAVNAILVPVEASPPAQPSIKPDPIPYVATIEFQNQYKTHVIGLKINEYKKEAYQTQLPLLR